MDGELATHPENLRWEDGRFGHYEVVDEAGDEDNSADGDGRCDQRHRIVRAAKICYANEEYGQAGREETQSDKVKTFEFIPSGPLMIVLWTGGREVAEKRADNANCRVDDGKIKAPSPAGMKVKLGSEEATYGSPRNGDAKLSPRESNSSALLSAHVLHEADAV